MTAVVFTRAGTTFTVRFRYDPAVVDLIKTVPSYARSWDPVAREWTIGHHYVVPLEAALRALGHQVIGLNPPPRAGGSGQWAHTLLHRVGPLRREPVFRALTRVLHPDNPATGDAVLQRELNTAREHLTERKTP
jgi:hypothetical protein